jgi:hypothetical protein
VKTLGKPIVFVICSGSAMAFNRTGFNAFVAGFSGSEGGGKGLAEETSYTNPYLDRHCQWVLKAGKRLGAYRFTRNDAGNWAVADSE